MIDPKPRLGATKIITNPDGTYLPDEGGDWAAVLPVYGFVDEPFDVTPEGEILWSEEHDLVDLVAWFLDVPGRWWLRHGGTTPVLGVRNLRMAVDLGDKIALFETPESWACAGGRGACVLNWGAAIYALFDGVSRLDCESPALKARIARTLRLWEPDIRGGAGYAAR